MTAIVIHATRFPAANPVQSLVPIGVAKSSSHQQSRSEIASGNPVRNTYPDNCQFSVKAAGNTPVLFDSSVRSGSDVVKALALGATAVGIGRPYCYGLALDGVGGIIHVLRSILAEADLLMAIDGYPTIADLRDAAVRLAL
jgi:hypothetical protein